MSANEKVDLQTYTVAELRGMLKQRMLKSSGRKLDLVERLMEVRLLDCVSRCCFMCWLFLKAQGMV